MGMGNGILSQSHCASVCDAMTFVRRAGPLHLSPSRNGLLSRAASELYLKQFLPDAHFAVFLVRQAEDTYSYPPLRSRSGSR